MSIHGNIICDLDGTIALDTGRSIHLHQNEECPKYVKPEDHTLQCICAPNERNWEAYFAASSTDAPCHGIIKLLAAMYARHTIYILSGRSNSTIRDTLKWLEKHNVVYHYLQLRGDEDRTDDHILKLRWARDFDLTPENTLFVLEDRQRVVDAWRSAGYRCFQVAPGSF